jgi:uncharacterized CHY-type Zn-finger protein
MSGMYVPDNLEQFNIHSQEQEDALEKRPLCSWCRQRIQSEHLYNIDGDLVCQTCINGCKEDTDDYTR